MAILERTLIEGLHWQATHAKQDPQSQYYVVDQSDGPAVSDLVTHEPNFQYHHFGIHIGQIDRLTFCGDPNQKIRGEFIDCRKGSPTLHKRISLEFNPNGERLLHIDRGIAHVFYNIEHVLTRDEPIWYLDDNNPAYNLGNDVVNIPVDIEDGDLPSFKINKLPIPDLCYRYVLTEQHRAYKESTPVYGMRYKVNFGGEEKFILIKRKKHLPLASAQRDPVCDTMQWSASYFASSGSDSYYLVESPGVRNSQLVFPSSHADLSSEYKFTADSDMLITFIGNPKAVVDFEVSRDNKSYSKNFSQDPLRSLFVPDKSRVAMRLGGFVTARIERLMSMESETAEPAHLAVPV